MSDFTEHHWLLVYDIAQARRLARVAKKCESYGIRTQHSVFEICATNKQIQSLLAALKKIIKPDEDSIMLFLICEHDWQRKEELGALQKTENDTGSFCIL